MKITIFGSTGGTGRELVRLGLDYGHAVTAFAREKEKLADVRNDQLRVVQGDVLDLRTVVEGVVGQDAVLSAIGAGRARTRLREDGTSNIIETMEQAGVKRLISLSSLGIGDSRSNLPFVLRYVVFPTVLRHTMADHERQERVIRQSNLDWTIVRPSYLTDGPLTGTYLHGFSITEKKLKGKIARADVADFMLKQLEDRRYVHETPGLSY
ncbi:MAG: SDR family oxidoreductase [Woeseiaceae bacterium]|nr:SDR family oxidoreductase [Woeseiaceae bacterium]